MTDYKSVYKQIQDRLKTMPMSSQLVLKTESFGLAKTIGLRDYESSPDREEIESLFLTAENREIEIGCILAERGFGYGRRSLAEMRMTARGERMVKNGAETIEL